MAKRCVWMRWPITRTSTGEVTTAPMSLHQFRSKSELSRVGNASQRIGSIGIEDCDP